MLMNESPSQKGYDLLNNPSLNKSTAFKLEERERLGLRGLLPHSSSSMDLQLRRVMSNMRRKETSLEKYIFLQALQARNERLFYRAIIEYIEEILPIIYTPTVGQACREFANIFRVPQGFYITPEDRGHIRTMLDNWPETDIKVIVITDGERILGLGDLGANGMGIPIGKLALYVACGGIHPSQCLPVMFDVGTNNNTLIEDPMYLGYPMRRLRGEKYDDLLSEFMEAVADKFPNALIQFEDFLAPNAYRILEKYRNKTPCFNDDIQGTAAVTLAGLYACCKFTNTDLKETRVLFVGAGAAATGIGALVLAALQASGLSESDARNKLWFVDQDGLLTHDRRDLSAHNKRFSQDQKRYSLIEAIEAHKPHALVGTTGVSGVFSREVVTALCNNHEIPAVFALSNPTSNAECTAEQAYEWSDGKVLYASGSPFDPVSHGQRILKPGQCNNAYVFPGIGLGATAVQAQKLTDDMFLKAAETLASCVTRDDFDSGSLYPPLTKIRTLSLEIAVAIAEMVFDQGLAKIPQPDDIRCAIQDAMYTPRY